MSDEAMFKRMSFDFRCGPERGCNYRVWRDGDDVKMTTTGPEGRAAYALPYCVFMALVASVGGAIEDRASEDYAEDQRGSMYEDIEDCAADRMVPPLHAAMTWPEWCGDLVDAGEGCDDASPSFAMGSVLAASFDSAIDAATRMLKPDANEGGAA